MATQAQSSAMKPAIVANAPIGMDVLAPERDMPEGSVRNLVNLDVTDLGRLVARPGSQRLTTQAGAHDLMGVADQAYGLYVDGDELCRIWYQDDDDLRSQTLLAGLTAGARMRYFEDATGVYFTNGHELGVVAPGGMSARLLGVDAPALGPDLTAVAGGLPIGRYSVAYSHISDTGEESGLSPASFLELSAAGAIEVTFPADLPDAALYRVYVTGTNGDTLYQIHELAVGMASVVIGDLQFGKQAPTQFMERMPAGHDVCIYKGVLCVLDGTRLRFSEPFAYGLTGIHNFVEFGARTLFCEPTEAGIFVGCDNGVHFLAGNVPGQWSQTIVSRPPICDDCTTVKGSWISNERPDAIVVVWLTEHGYAYGVGGGQVSLPQSKRMALAQAGEGVLFAMPGGGLRKIVAIVDDTPLSGLAALDSDF